MLASVHSQISVAPLRSVMDFERFYQLEFPAMVALARAISGDVVAEDIAQEAMAKAHQQWPKVSSYDRPGAWLRRVTINLAISRRRRATRELTALRRKALERRADEIHAPDRDHDVWEAVRKLAPRQRAVVALFYQEACSTKDIAEILECSVSTVTSHLNQARGHLANALGEAANAGETVDLRESTAPTEGLI